MASSATVTPFSPYQKKLLLFLSVATFFEGFDFFALSQILPQLRGEWSLSKAQAGLLVTIVNLGTVIAYLLVRSADRWGRKPVLTITIAGYTLASLATAFAPNVYVFAVCQLAGRIFLIAEWAVAMVFAAEEFPASRRGLVIGLIQAQSSLGSIVCAGLVPLLLKLPWGWRTIYVVGVIPLLIIAVARRSIKETRRFEEQVQAGPTPQLPLMRIWSTPYKKRLLQVAGLWALTYLCTQTAIVFWKEFAVSERHFTDGQVGLAMTLAAGGSMPFVFAAGKLLDRVGRRVGAIFVFLATVAGVAGAYLLASPVLLGLALAIGIFGTNSVLPVLNAFTTELFPTELRSDAFAWANNLLGRTTYVVAPFLVGIAAERIGWSGAVSLTTLGPLAALVLILWLMPETRGKELEETARV